MNTADIQKLQAFVDNAHNGNRYTLPIDFASGEYNQERAFELLMDLVWNGKNGLVDLKTDKTIRFYLTHDAILSSVLLWRRTKTETGFDYISRIREYTWPTLVPNHETIRWSKPHAYIVIDED